ncbi:MAG: hypothetical protein H6672_04035 [Anaerolineaceae bacterium]|nr:hypothetical protein [Anaerolineaceae bacterium]
MISIDVWTFIKDIYNIFRRILKRDNTQEKVTDSLIDIRFGGGQPHLGKPEIWITNNAQTDLLSITLKIRFKRTRKFTKWNDYIRRDWQIIRPNDRATYTLSFKEVAEKLKVLENLPQETDEIIPEYADLLYPNPVVFRVTVEFIFENVQYVKNYILRPTCIYPQNLTVYSSSTGKLYWSFKKIY